MKVLVAVAVAALSIALVPCEANAQAKWSSLVPAVPVRATQTPAVVDDPVSDGIGWGAAIGAGAGIGLVALTYATCDAGCEAPAAGPLYLFAGGVGAGTGALIGWLVDRAHTSRPAASRAVSVAPVIARRYRAVAVSVRF